MGYTALTDECMQLHCRGVHEQDPSDEGSGSTPAPPHNPPVAQCGRRPPDANPTSALATVGDGWPITAEGTERVICVVTKRSWLDQRPSRSTFLKELQKSSAFGEAEDDLFPVPSRL